MGFSLQSLRKKVQDFEFRVCTFPQAPRRFAFPSLGIMLWGVEAAHDIFREGSGLHFSHVASSHLLVALQLSFGQQGLNWDDGHFGFRPGQPRTPNCMTT